MNTNIQLFARDGTFVDTVSIHKHAEIVIWKGLYYALRDGRYVECDVAFASPNDDTIRTSIMEHTPGIVTTQVRAI